MRITAGLSILALLIAALFIEKRASVCGAGLLATQLPYGLKADWFNGTFWLTDSEGWGVVAPPVDLDAGGEADLRVQRVSRYTIEHGVIVEVILESGDSALLSLEGSTVESIHTSLLEPGALRQKAGDIEALSWVEVDPRSCFYGRVGVVRILDVLGLLSALVLVLRSRQDASSGAQSGEE